MPLTRATRARAAADVPRSRADCTGTTLGVVVVASPLIEPFGIGFGFFALVACIRTSRRWLGAL
jgi:hypothetical protein